MDAVASGRISLGKLELHGRAAFRKALAAMKSGEVIIRVSRRQTRRSLDQNAWYWGCIVEAIADHTGYTPDETHEVLKQLFIPKRLAVQNGNGEIVKDLVIGGSTTSLTTLEFADYCEAIRQWAAQDLDVVIPDPDTDAAHHGIDTSAYGWGI